MKLSKHQDRLMAQVKFAIETCELPEAYIETGLYKPFDNVTVKSLVKRGLINAKPNHSYDGVGSWYVTLT